MRDQMLIRKEWLDNCESLSIKQKQEVYYQVLRHGLYGEKVDNIDDPMVQMAINFIVPQVDRMVNAYEAAVEIGKRGGRKPNPHNDQIAALIAEGLNGREIASRLGIPQKQIYETPAWKNRPKKRKN